MLPCFQYKSAVVQKENVIISSFWLRETFFFLFTTFTIATVTGKRNPYRVSSSETDVFGGWEVCVGEQMKSKTRENRAARTYDKETTQDLFLLTSYTPVWLSNDIAQKKKYDYIMLGISPRTGLYTRALCFVAFWTSSFLVKLQSVAVKLQIAGYKP